MLQKFQNYILGALKYIKKFPIANAGNFNVKLHRLDTKLKVNLRQKLRLPYTDNPFTIKALLIMG